MPINKGCERRPTAPDLSYVPTGSYPYNPKDGDSWWTLADRLKAQGHPDFQVDRNIGALRLVRFNFKTAVPEEINWYLFNKAGCRMTTYDQMNYVFSSEPQQLIYLPVLRGDPIIVIGEPPKNLFKGVWVGVGGKFGGGNNFKPPPLRVPRPGEIHIPIPSIPAPLPDIKGNDELYVSLWSLDRDRRGENFIAKIDVERTGFNWGASGGLVVVIVTGLDKPNRLQGFTTDGWDFNTNIGSNWGALFKRGKDVKGLQRFAKFLATTVSKRESLKPEKWEKIWEAAKIVNGFAGHGYNSGQIELTVIDVPLPGVPSGAELSLFTSETRVTAVIGHTKVDMGAEEELVE